MVCSNRKLARFSLYLAIALSLWVFEEFIPRPMPWLKPGFSYIAILLAMLEFDIKTGFAVGILRVFLGALILGRLFSPSFILSLSGTIVALVVMSALMSIRGKFVSLIGISIAGAFSHLATQILVAGAIFYRIDAVIWLMPISTIWAIVAGAIVGIITERVSLLRFQMKNSRL